MRTMTERMPNKSIAHRSDDGRTHDLTAHLAGTAALARCFASPWGAGETAHLAGIWHDLGKYAAEFQNLIAKAGDDGHLEETEATPRQWVDHSSAGAQWAFELGMQKKLPQETALALAYAIAGHHAGLSDWSGNESGRHGLKDRLITSDGLRRARNAAPPTAILNQMVPQSKFLAEADTSLWIRMLASALFDADFLDTEAFFDPRRSAARLLTQSPPMASLSETLACRMSAAFEKESGDVNTIRAMVLGACRAAAVKQPGFFALTVPTGGGKTLASLSFALGHAAKNKMRRIIYAIPFTSIIEQTADVFRNFLGDDIVLEHHSAIEPDRFAKDTNHWRLASENWDAPLIVTTTVQLFESLFAARTSRVRKLHNIANSVLILDEAQALAPAVLKPVTMILDQLVKHYRVTVVLCTATQPALRDVFKDLPRPTEIVPEPERLFRKLDRVAIEMPKSGERRTWADVAADMAAQPQVLAIVNTRSDCRILHNLLPEGAVHLSTWQCPAHRAALLKRIKDDLAKKHSVRVVSTSLIEAGVDIDFPVVLRAMTGLDSLAQAAGRCNRNGLLDKGRFVVFRPVDEKPRGHFLQVIQAVDRMIGRLGDAPFHPDAFHEYFRELYWAKGEDALDKFQMRLLLGLGTRFPDILAEMTKGGGIRFREAAETFRMIEDAQETVIIPYDDDARKAIGRLRAMGPERGVLRALQRYTVPVRRESMAQLRDTAALDDVDGISVLAREELYRPDVGLDLVTDLTVSIQDLII